MLNLHMLSQTSITDRAQVFSGHLQESNERTKEFSDHAHIGVHVCESCSFVFTLPSFLSDIRKSWKNVTVQT